MAERVIKEFSVRLAPDGWQVVGPLTAEIYKNKELAVSAARKLALEAQPSRLTIYYKDGAVDFKHRYPRRGGHPPRA